jgi:hypothetical protein
VKVLKLAEDHRADYAGRLTKIATKVGTDDLQPIGMFVYVQYADGTHMRFRRYSEGFNYASAIGIIEAEKADIIQEIAQELVP